MYIKKYLYTISPCRTIPPCRTGHSAAQPANMYRPGERDDRREVSRGAARPTLSLLPHTSNTEYYLRHLMCTTSVHIVPPAGDCTKEVEPSITLDLCARLLCRFISSVVSHK